MLQLVNAPKQHLKQPYPPLKTSGERIPGVSVKVLEVKEIKYYRHMQ